jgi:hypothetical protein
MSWGWICGDNGAQNYAKRGAGFETTDAHSTWANSKLGLFFERLSHLKFISVMT